MSKSLEVSFYEHWLDDAAAEAIIPAARIYGSLAEETEPPYITVMIEEDVESVTSFDSEFIAVQMTIEYWHNSVAEARAAQLAGRAVLGSAFQARTLESDEGLVHAVRRLTGDRGREVGSAARARDVYVVRVYANYDVPAP